MILGVVVGIRVGVRDGIKVIFVSISLLSDVSWVVVVVVGVGCRIVGRVERLLSVDTATGLVVGGSKTKYSTGSFSSSWCFVF